MDVDTYVPFGSSSWGDLPGPPTPVPSDRPIGGGQFRSASKRKALSLAEERKNNMEEEAAIRSMAFELVTNSTTSIWPSKAHRFKSDDFKHATAASVPTERHIQERKKDIECHSDLPSRNPPPFDVAGRYLQNRVCSTDDTSLYQYVREIVYHDDEEDSADDTSAKTPLQYAISTYCGRKMQSEELGAMTATERFSNLVYLNDTWINPSPAGTSHEYGKYGLKANEYGEFLDLKSDIETMEDLFSKARQASNTVATELLLSNALGPERKVACDEDAFYKIKYYFDASSPVCAVQECRTRTRKLIMERWKHLNEGKRINRRIQHNLIKIRSKMTSVNFFERAYSSDDVFKCIIDFLSPIDACALLYVRKWDYECIRLLKGLLPALRIFELKGHFPHLKDADGTMLMHKQAMVKCAIGIAYHKRCTSDTSNNQDSSSINDIQTFEARSTYVGAKYTQTWTLYETVSPHGTRIVTVPAHKYFYDPPKIDVKLVDYETGEAYDPLSEFGGLVPEHCMQRIYAANRHPRLHFNIDHQKWPRLPSTNFAVMSRFSLKNVSVCNRKLKLVATVTGKRTNNVDPLVLTAESVPFRVVSSLKNAQQRKSKKRKSVDL